MTVNKTLATLVSTASIADAAGVALSAAYLSMKQGSLKGFTSLPPLNGSSTPLADLKAMAYCIDKLTNMSLSSLTTTLFSNTNPDVPDDPPGSFRTNTLSFRVIDGANPINQVVERIPIPQFSPQGLSASQVDAVIEEIRVLLTKRFSATDKVIFLG